jgi:spermidine/putrescine transport system permease protein
MSIRKTFLDEFLLTIPSFTWLFVFFLIPTLIIFGYAFKPYDIYGGITEGWTLDTIKSLANPNYFLMIWRTLWLSSLTTLISVALALPIGYQLACTSKKLRQILLLLIVVPFWSSFLIRIFAWKTLLHPEGAFKQFLVWAHIVNADTSLLYNSGAVLLVMVYTYLPFAVFPIYAAASKFNFQLLEAAMDLGATRSRAFFHVLVPGIKKGIFTAVVMVFIPAIGAYVIPDLVGGSNSEMIGNKIAQRTFVERNLPQASALSALLALSVLIPMAGLSYLTSRSKQLESVARNKE